MSEPLPLSQVLAEEYVRLHGPLPDDVQQLLQEQVPNEPDAPKRHELEKNLETRKLKGLYAEIHKLKTPRTALCFSGGGIRSATFALGVTQGLARLGLLPQFDFLSTVSGGGYIGSWLSSYVRRNPGGVSDVSATLNGVPPEVRDPLNPEVPPLTWLRSFSNYVTPKLGLFSGDTWAGAGSFLRNLLLNWLVFVPFLLSMLALPRLGVALLRAEEANAYLTAVYAGLAGLLILYGTAVVACERPVSYKYPGTFTNGKFLGQVLLPYFVAAMLLALAWAKINVPATPGATSPSSPLQWWQVYAGFAAISLLNAIVYMVRFSRDAKTQRRGNVRHGIEVSKYTTKKLWTEIGAALVSSVAAAGLLHAAAKQLFDDPTKSIKLPVLIAWKTIPPSLPTANAEIYLCLAVPLVLGILFVQSAIFVAGVSWYNEEYDREWWGRAAGWVLAAGLAWMGGTAIAVWGPVLIYEGPRLFSTLTGLTGLFAIGVGKSGKTSANKKEEEENASATSTGLKLSLGVIAPIFVICILALLSLVTSDVLLSIPSIYEQIPPAERIKPADLDFAQNSSFHVVSEEKDSHGLRKYETTVKPAVEKDKLDAIRHLWAIDHTGFLEAIILVFGPLLFSWLASFFVGVNQFSLHSLYRNRLIRGYLGASRFQRHPNLFSGFDPNDNLPMYRLRPEMFWATSFTKIGELGALLQKDVRLKDRLRQPTVDALADAAKHPDDTEICHHAGDLLSFDLNGALEEELEHQYPQSLVPKTVQNRRLIESDYKDYIEPMETHRRPLHIINTTLNLVGGDKLAWQERKGETFTVTPHYTGNFLLGYRETSRFGGPDGVSLGTAVAISGAAASPNMGYNSSPAISFLLSLFNVRLGWWYGNPRKDTWERKNPKNSLMTFLNEVAGNTNSDHDYIYLSDGGHFDNLGLYEMILRRCHCIVVSDAGADLKFAFDDLGMAIRKIRIDFGVRITFEEVGLVPRTQPFSDKARYCAVGTIHYSDVDGGDPDKVDGHLLYFKPTFYGADEPKDVYNYARSNETFPHQSTGDQWFSESQFESYRALGQFSVEQIKVPGSKDPQSICELIDRARDYVKNQPSKADTASGSTTNATAG